MTDAYTHTTHNGAGRGNRRDRTPEEIEREIDAERDRITSTIDALEEKVSVGAIVDRLGTALGDEAGPMMRGLTRTVRDNPVPIAMIGLGVAWLALSGRDSDEREYRDGEYLSNSRGLGMGRGRDPYRDALWADAEVGHLDPAFTADDDGRTGEGRVEALQRRAGQAKDRVRGAAASGAERAGSKADDLRARGRQTASEAQRAAYRARHRASSLLEDNPLASGALAFVAGAALGALTPNSDAENRVFGPRSEAMRRQAGAAAQDGLDRGRRAAEAAVDAAADELADRLDHAANGDGATKAQTVRDEAAASAARVAEAAEKEAQKPSGSTT